MIGKVKFFNSDKGFGFIVPEDSNAPDVFVHIKDIQKSGLDELRQGQRVSFDLVPSRNGKNCAGNIAVV